ncbi:MAG: hypothetical protein LWW77_07620 [Propionibacteriales bacterium]|nr:hypothetical protein [Propionibacteriales bacterium]
MSELEFVQETTHPPSATIARLTEKALFGLGQALVGASVRLAAARRRRIDRRVWNADPELIEQRLDALRIEQARWLLGQRQL